MPWMMILHRLDLTDEQKEAIKGILQDSREQAEATRKAVAEAHRALHKAVVGGAEEDIRTAATAVGTAIGDLAVHKANTFATVKQALTEEQRAELEEILGKLKERAQEFREKMQDPELREKLQQRRGRGRRGGAGPGWGGPPHRRPGPRGWW
jgi:Spy/CpxP family protein refolding chaperone